MIDEYDELAGSFERAELDYEDMQSAGEWWCEACQEAHGHEDECTAEEPA